ncbi:hypothetical protein Btru_044820 [Bulinus truncatus]|nr:hypothetical protein Btru_044820 [Bulinus truncatus]
MEYWITGMRLIVNCVISLLIVYAGLCMPQTTTTPALITSPLVLQYNSSTTTATTVTFNPTRFGVSSTSFVFTSNISPISQGQRNVTNQSGSISNISPISQGQRIVSNQNGSMWLKCVGQPRSREEATVVSLLSSWCQQNETIVNCLSRDFTSSGGGVNNALDFFVNLTYSQQQLRRKSSALCKKRDKLGCTATANQSYVTSCLGSFSSGLAHIFGLHNEKKLPLELLRDVACDVILQTTLCLRDSFTACDGEVQTVLVNYYSLFTNESCIAKFGQTSGSTHPETVVDKCAKEAAETMPPNQHEPVSLRDFLILGLRTDCRTYPVRYGCYGRELGNITNFRDFWLSLTFDQANAMASQKTYCDQIETTVISKINEDCFSQAHPNLATCEIGFGRELEAIRDEWFGNSNLDGLELQTLACRTSVARAACLNHAMQPCGSEVASIMAVSEMGILPDICRQLLVPETFTQDLKNKSDPDLANDHVTLNSNINRINGDSQPRSSTAAATSTAHGRFRPGHSAQILTQRSTVPTKTVTTARAGAITVTSRPTTQHSSQADSTSTLKTDHGNHQHNFSNTIRQQKQINNGANCGQLCFLVMAFLSFVWLALRV